MKVFISWSGKRSQQVANYLHEWLPQVIQSCEPFVSTKDVEPGTIWFTEIGNQLADTSVGIICLTKENYKSPWILFEAGALMKGLTTSRVCPILIDLQMRDIEPPLSQFNLITVNKESVKKILETINHQQIVSLAPAILDKVFEKNWPDLESAIKQIIDNTEISSHEVVKRSQDDILNEMLLTLRNLEKRVSGNFTRLGPNLLASSPWAYAEANDKLAMSTAEVAKSINNFLRFIYRDSHEFPTLENAWQAYGDRTYINKEAFQVIYDKELKKLTIERDNGSLPKLETPITPKGQD